jgi:hypothetical protein
MTIGWILFGAVAFCLLPLDDSLMTSFKRVKFLKDGANLCAANTPSASITVEDIEKQFPMQFETPNAVRCAFFYETTSDAAFANSVGFNYRDDVRRCEYFSTVPTNCTREKGCSYFSVSLLNQLLSQHYYGVS